LIGTRDCSIFGPRATPAEPSERTHDPQKTGFPVIGSPGKAGPLRLQSAVFALVAASFTNIYITQPVLPELQREFAVGASLAAWTVGGVLLGITLANLPFGALVDRLPIRPIILVSGAMVAGTSVVCALAGSIAALITARFLQGLFIPGLTTCLAAYLAKILPPERLNVVLGTYVSATVLGGLAGRLLGGWVHPPPHWRWAFCSASLLLLAAVANALQGLPSRPPGEPLRPDRPVPGYGVLLRRCDLLRLYLAGTGSFFIFSSIFNTLPFRLAAPPFAWATERITLLYLVYLVGVFMGPAAGRLSNRWGSGRTLTAGTLVLGMALGVTLLPAAGGVVAGLLGLSAGFFTTHAAAVGALNRRLRGGQGRANALYVLFYYAGGWSGITLCSMAYDRRGWPAVAAVCFLALTLPLAAGIGEWRSAADRRSRSGPRGGAPSEHRVDRSEGQTEGLSHRLVSDRPPDDVGPQADLTVGRHGRPPALAGDLHRIGQRGVGQGHGGGLGDRAGHIGHAVVDHAVHGKDGPRMGRRP
jgi:YNFM family putative membrane transporter